MYSLNKLTWFETHRIGLTNKIGYKTLKIDKKLRESNLFCKTLKKKLFFSMMRLTGLTMMLFVRMVIPIFRNYMEHYYVDFFYFKFTKVVL